MRWMWGVIGLSVAVVVVAAAALIVALGSSGTAVAELELGECFDLPTLDGSGRSVEVLEQVDVIDCDEPHQAQVVLVGELNPGGELAYPNDADLFASVDRECLAAARVVGDEFGLLPIAPTDDTWNRLGGRFQCLAVPYGGGRTTGALSVSGPSG